MSRLVGILPALLLLAAVPPAARAAAAPTQQEVEESLTCQCGCGLTVHSCNHLQCPSGEPMKAEIRERLARGETKDVILAAFVSKYGEKVLSSPTMSGFNWLAWITPFAALLAAGTVLVVVVRRRLGRETATAAPPAAPPVLDPARRARLERALGELDDEGA